MQILIEQVDDLAGWHKDANYWERKLSQQKQAQEAWVAKRKAENAARKEAGQDLLPEKDPKNPIFKPLDAKYALPPTPPHYPLQHHTIPHCNTTPAPTKMAAIKGYCRAHVLPNKGTG